jgi:hypothetical protein
MSFILAVFLASSQAAVPASPTVPASPATAAATAAKPKKEKLICKAKIDDTGSRMVQRTCLTQEQWDAQTQGRSMDQMETLPTSH